MIVSWNELQRTCQKAFRGLGVPAGVDDESSFAVLWLQARGLDALTPLDAALSMLEHMPPRPLEFGLDGGGSGVNVLDAGGQNAVSVASDAIDFAIARATERASRAEVLVSQVEGAVFIAGTLAQRRAPGRCAAVQWRDDRVRRRLEVAPDGACRVAVASPDGADFSGGPGRSAVRISIDGSGRYRWPERDRSWRTDIDESELERQVMHSLSRNRRARYAVVRPDGVRQANAGARNARIT